MMRDFHFSGRPLPDSLISAGPASLHSGVPNFSPFDPAATAALNGEAGGVLTADLSRIISRALDAARTAGQDTMGQCRSAAEAVLNVRPDVSFSDALRWVMAYQPD